MKTWKTLLEMIEDKAVNADQAEKAVNADQAEKAVKAVKAEPVVKADQAEPVVKAVKAEKAVKADKDDQDSEFLDNAVLEKSSQDDKIFGSATDLGTEYLEGDIPLVIPDEDSIGDELNLRKQTFDATYLKNLDRKLQNQKHHVEKDLKLNCLKNKDCKADDCKADDCKVDDCKADECMVDDCKADDCMVDDYKKYKCKVNDCIPCNPCNPCNLCPYKLECQIKENVIIKLSHVLMKF